jgi:Arc/MetJ-type ribon-helix-helix transcriptional regulator
MTFEVPIDVEQLIKQQMATGRYQSLEELLRDALQHLALKGTAGEAASPEKTNGTALDALAQHGLVGAIKSGHKDLGSNPAHMKGFGKNGS